MRGLLVTGTDTGVGKTVLSAALIAAIAAAGMDVRAHKPIVTGLDDYEPSGLLDGWPADHVLLGQVAGMPPQDVAPLRYGPAVSPHLAARLQGTITDPRDIVEHASAAVEDAQAAVVEGAGGLLAPLAEDFTVRDLALALSLPLLIAARPGLGTINHTLLTVQAARAAGLQVLAVVLTPWPERPSLMEESNRDTIRQLGHVEVHTLARVDRPDTDELARAGATLPWRRWLQSGQLPTTQP